MIVFAAVIKVYIASVSTQDHAIFPQLSLTPIILHCMTGQAAPVMISDSERNEFSSDIQAHLEFLRAELCLQIAQLRPNAISDYYRIHTATVSSITSTATCQIFTSKH